MWMLLLSSIQLISIEVPKTIQIPGIVLAQIRFLFLFNLGRSVLLHMQVTVNHQYVVVLQDGTT